MAESNYKTIIDQMNELKTQYYVETDKKHFFKKQQKMQVASAISEKIDIREVLARTYFNIPNTHHVYFDYTVFKIYANPANYTMIISYALELINTCVKKYGYYEMHINLHTFSISALERYKECIDLYLNECIKANTEYYNVITCLHIYHTPSVIDTIANMLHKMIHPEIKRKVKKYGKSESEIIIQNIFSSLAL
jgi:hypothetical protein